jgi:hypothetical protein
MRWNLSTYGKLTEGGEIYSEGPCQASRVHTRWLAESKGYAKPFARAQKDILNYAVFGNNCWRKEAV